MVFNLFPRDDWPLIKRATLCLGVSSLAALLILGSAYGFRSSAGSRLAQAEARRQEATTKLANARTEQQDIVEYLARYQQLASTGVMQEERRLDWIEQLERARAALQITDLDYELQAQQPLTIAALQPLNVTPYANRMRVTLGLMHEGELLAFIQNLKQQARGLFLLKQCRMERQPGGVGAINLTAECLMDWITLKHASEITEAPPADAPSAPAGVFRSKP